MNVCVSFANCASLYEGSQIKDSVSSVNTATKASGFLWALKKNTTATMTSE